jgi:hypothetical protein
MSDSIPPKAAWNLKLRAKALAENGIRVWQGPIQRSGLQTRLLPLIPQGFARRECATNGFPPPASLPPRGGSPGFRIASCKHLAQGDCGSQVFGGAVIFDFPVNIDFRGVLRVGTFVAKRIATSYRRDNERQLPPKMAGIACIPAFFFFIGPLLPISSSLIAAIHS